MGFGSKKQTVGYKYYIGMHLAVCHGPVDEVQQIAVGDRLAWSGNVTSTQDVAISAENLFGGEKREGGVSGTVGFKFGEANQAQDAYLAARLGPDCPAFRGVLSFVLKHVYIGNNPYLKNWAFRVKRLPAKGWYDAKRAIGGHANPAHILYECVTNADWGMGYPAPALDDSRFRACADTLHAESFGLSLLFNRQGPIHEFIQQVLDHIGGVFRMNPSTGLFELKLIRSDYAPAGLPLLNESNVVSLDSYQRAAFGETVNEIVLKYTTADEKDASITVQDLGNIQVQGGVVSETVSYPGIRDDGLAQRVAMRDLKARSTPLGKIRLTVNRQGWSLRAGDVFRFSWPKLGLADVVYRVGSVQGGTLQDGKITVEAVEDIFGLPTNSYAAQQPVGWASPNNAPAAAPYRLAYEAAYWDIVRALGENDAQAQPADVGYLIAAAVRPSPDAVNFTLKTRSGLAAFAEQAVGNFCPTCTLSADLPPAVSSTIAFSGGVDMDDVEVGEYAIVGGVEWVAVTAIDPAAGTLAVDRGVLDTVPVSHAAGSRIFFPYDFNGIDPTEWLAGETVDAKLLPTTGLGSLSEASAPTDSVTMARRQARPYPPGNVQINGQRWPAAIAGDLAVSWSHRDRVQQTAGFVKQDAGNIGPEAGQTYTLRIYNAAGILKHTESGLTGTTYTYPAATEQAENGTLQDALRIELESSRGGLTSLQRHDIRVDRAGWGLHWGLYWGGPAAGSSAGVATTYTYGDSFVSGEGTTHRYWRMRAWTGLVDWLEVSEIQLWSGAGNENASATVTSDQGNPGAVVDGNLSSRVYWHISALPVIAWDFGVGGKTIVGVKMGGFDTANRYPTGFVIEYSDDNVNWTQKAAPAGLTYPGHYTLSSLIPV